MTKSATTVLCNELGKMDYNKVLQLKFTKNASKFEMWKITFNYAHSSKAETRLSLLSNQLISVR